MPAMPYLHTFWSWMVEWVPYALPAIANGVLVFLGVWLSLPDFAQKVQDNPTYRKLLATLCIALGLVGLFADVRARHDGDKSNRQLIEKVGTALNKTNELLTKTSELLTKTNSLVTNTDFRNFATIALPRLARLHAEVADLRRQIVAANEKHDPQLVTDLETKAKQAQEHADRISKELQVLARAAAIVQQLREWQIASENRQLALLSDANSERAQYRHDHPGDDGEPQITKKYTALAQKASDQSDEDLRGLIANADSIRKELIQWVPNQNALDKTMEQQFAQTKLDLRGADPMKDAAYIEDLIKRVPPPK